jgi:hypothetical protein
MKLCALILAHHKPGMLGRLVRRIERAGVAAYVHIDARANQSEFEDACRNSGVIFLAERLPIYWGGFSMVEAVVRLAEYALRNPAFTHFLHISGDSYPIKPDAELLASLSQDVDWIDVAEAKFDSRTYQRIANAYLPDSNLGALKLRFHEERYLTAEVIERFDEIRRIFAMKTSQKFPWRYAKGANWWCLRRKTLDECVRVIQEDCDFVSWFRYSSNPDESVFNSVVLNFTDAQLCQPCPVFTIWGVVPAPYEFHSLEDIHQIRASPRPFARKFSADADDLLELLDSM